MSDLASRAGPGAGKMAIGRMVFDSLAVAFVLVALIRYFAIAGRHD